MSYRQKLKKVSWGRRIIQGVLGITIFVLLIDYGKHFVLKRVLENEIAQSREVVSVGSFTISFWPLFESHLVLTNFHVNVSGIPLLAREVYIRQGWKDWDFAHIQAIKVTSDEVVAVQEAQGMLDTRDLRTCVNVSNIILKGIHVKLPLLEFFGQQAVFNFLYQLATHRLSLKVDAPEMSFPNGATFGLNGQGEISTEVPIHGKMDVKIKNIDKMMKELVAAGVVDASQAGMVTTGSDFLGKIGLHDITLPLRIQDGDVTLGPIPLFKIGGI